MNAFGGSMKTRGLVEGAIFAAIIVMITVASNYIPFLVIFMFFIPVPIIILGERQGMKISIIASAGSAILIGIFLWPLNGVIFGILLLLVGVSMGYMYYKESNALKKISVGFIGFLCVIIAVIVSFQFLMGIDFTTYLMDMFKVSMDEAYQIYQGVGFFDANQLAMMKESADDQIQAIALGIPSAFLLFPLVCTVINVLICDSILSHLGYSIKKLKPLKDWVIPPSLKYFLMLLILGSFMINIFGIEEIPEIYRFTIMNFVYLIFGIMGFSLIFDYLDYKKVKNKGVKVFVIILGLLMFSLVTMMGIAEVFLGVRRFFRREQK
jgi:uncharacterized protein YybS (DUF2232 family)